VTWSNVISHMTSQLVCEHCCHF